MMLSQMPMMNAPTTAPGTEPMPPICDIQRLFSDVNGCRDRKGLKVAMEMLGIEPDAARYFHNALHDAYYTALVFARLP